MLGRLAPIAELVRGEPASLAGAEDLRDTMFPDGLLQGLFAPLGGHSIR